MFDYQTSKHAHFDAACRAFALSHNLEDVATAVGMRPQILRNKLNPVQPHRLTCDELLAIGEVQRTPECAALNAKKGTGIANSLHTQRLAVDLNLFVNGKYMTDTKDYLPLGEYWETLGGTWGGRFKSRPDGNHFSLEHNGVR